MRASRAAHEGELRRPPSPHTEPSCAAPGALNYAQREQLTLGVRLGIGWIVIVVCSACLGLCSGDVERAGGPDGSAEVAR